MVTASRGSWTASIPRGLLAVTFAWGWLAFAAGAPDFTGTWLINPAKSQNLGMMAAVRQTITITQTGTEMTLAEASDFQGQKSERTVRYDLGGKPVTNEAAMGGKSETVARWDGARLVVTWTSEGTVAGTKNVRTEVRSLAADGKTMTVESIRGGNKPMVMVFDRLR
jgi:hypothetical protein